MILESGLELGGYEILALIGQGSMGKVYRARDRKLGREVALKVLSQEFARREEDLARFQREARVLALLNHPNIAIIHDVGKVGETSFIVLELIEGDTLEEVIARGRLPISRTLELSLQLTEALEAAHARGIVHRDLKPANVKVTSEGKLKVLDFGIAKYFDAPHGAETVSANPDDAPTESGVVLGTAGYMSPEQIRGTSLDGRSDIWSFGCVLFELLTGKRAFRGKTPTDTLVQVLEGEPDWKALPAGLPASIERGLRHCLVKERGRRLQAIGDIRIEIEDLLEGETPIDDANSRSRRAGVSTTALALALAAGLGAGFFAARERYSPVTSAEPTIPGGRGRATRFSFGLSEDQRLPYAGERCLALTADGSRLAYVVQERDGSTRIYQRPLDRLESSLVPNTHGAREPFFSPDSSWLGFFATSDGVHRLQRVSFEGGVPVVFHEESRSPLGGVVWTDQNEVVFAAPDGLRAISSNGGVPRVLGCAEAANTGEVCRWPEMLPGGTAMVYTAAAGEDGSTARIVATSFVTGERRTLVEGGSAARYSRTGHLIYAQNGSLFAAPFDPEKLQFTMPPSRLASDVLTDSSTGAAQFAVSWEGTLAFVAGARTDARRRLLSLDGAGRLSWASDSGLLLRGTFRVAPDGRRVALALDERGILDVWIYDLETHDLRRFTSGGSDDTPLWSPDGTRIVFRSSRSGRPLLFSKEILGDGPAVPLADRDDLNQPESWAGTQVAFTVRTEEGGFDVWTIDVGTGEASALVSSRWNETEPAYSPDGKKLAYVSDVSGQEAVYVIGIRPGQSGEAARVSAGGGRTPHWSSDGTRLFYRRGEGLLRVEIEDKTGSPVGSAELVWSMEVDTPFEVLPGGGFLVVENQAAHRQIVIVSNFTAELEQ